MLKLKPKIKFRYKPRPFPPEIERSVFVRQGGRCANPDCNKRLTDFDRPDHKIPQTKTNIRIYGEALIHSEVNCWIPCQHCHANKRVWGNEELKRVENIFKQHSKSKIDKSGN